MNMNVTVWTANPELKKDILSISIDGCKSTPQGCSFTYSLVDFALKFDRYDTIALCL
jgi:hypothetical protein